MRTAAIIHASDATPSSAVLMLQFLLSGAITGGWRLPKLLRMLSSPALLRLHMLNTLQCSACPWGEEEGKDSTEQRSGDP